MDFIAWILYQLAIMSVFALPVVIFYCIRKRLARRRTVSDAPPQSWFLMYPLTPIILSLVAGLLLMANTLPDWYTGKRNYRTICYGWPCTVYIDADWHSSPPDDTPGNIGECGFNSKTGLNELFVTEAIIDLIVGAEILFFVAVFCEWWFRRRELRQLDPAPRKKRLRFQFSLLTLVLLSLFAGCGGMLYLYSTPWVLDQTLPNYRGSPTYSPDGRYLCVDVGQKLLPGEEFFEGSEPPIPIERFISGLGVLDATSGAEVAFIKGQFDFKICADSQRVLVWDSELNFRYCSFPDGRELSRVKLATSSPENTDVLCVASDQKLAATNAHDGSVRLWDLSNGAELTALGEAGHDFNKAEFSSDGKYLLVSDDAGTALVWNIEAQQRQCVIQSRKRSRFRFSRNGKNVQALVNLKALAPRLNDRCDVFDVKTGELRSSDIARLRDVADFETDDGRVLDMYFPHCGDGMTLMIKDGSDPEELSADTKHCLYTICNDSDSNYPPHIFSSDGNNIVTHCYDGIKIWRRVRPERCWGVFYMYEFWLTLACGGVLLWSLRRDYRDMRLRTLTHG